MSRVRSAARPDARSLTAPVAASERPSASALFYSGASRGRQASRGRGAARPEAGRQGKAFPSLIRDGPRSALVANHEFGCAAEAARSLKTFKAARSADRAGHDAGLSERGEVKPVGDTVVAERRSIHATNERLDPLTNARRLAHAGAITSNRSPTPHKVSGGLRRAALPRPFIPAPSADPTCGGNPSAGAAVGAFADPDFPMPEQAVWTEDITAGFSFQRRCPPIRELLHLGAAVRADPAPE